MFSIFLNNEFKGFWQNKENDIFIELTCSSMKWNKDEVDLYFYPFVNDHPDNYNFEHNKKLIILKNTSELIEKLDENNDIILDENGSPVMESAETVSIESEHEPIVYMVKGVFVKPC